MQLKIHTRLLLLFITTTHGSSFLQNFFKAYFADGLNIVDERVLRGLVEKTGMNGEKAMAALTNPELVSTYEEEVREAVRKGKQL